MRRGQRVELDLVGLGIWALGARSPALPGKLETAPGIHDGFPLQKKMVRLGWIDLDWILVTTHS